MQLVLGRSRRTETRHKRCFFCDDAFSFERDDVIVIVDGEDRLSEVADRHVCSSCTKPDDAALLACLGQAAQRHRQRAATLREQAEAEDRLAARIDTMAEGGIDRVWHPDFA